MYTGGLRKYVFRVLNRHRVPSSVLSASANDIGHNESVSVVMVVDLIIARAFEARASDIHIDPCADCINVRIRVDGILRLGQTLPRALHAEIISRIKILSALRTDEHHAVQDGRFRHRVNGEESDTIDVRVSIVPTYYGENVVLRLLSDRAEEFALEALGFTSINRKKILRAASRPHGMILATGPTGSGKTTTLYTLVKILNDPAVSIVTIEDPIEYSITGVSQIQINPRVGLTFGSGLRGVLRQDPNIIMVGEIRDTETASIAVNTALTGHVVLSTLHTNDAPTTLPRLLDMHIEPYLIASTVNVVIGQRLVRRICRECIQERTLTLEEQQSLLHFLPETKKDAIFYIGKGCEYCSHSGFSGRAGIQEVMEVDDVIRTAILQKLSSNDIRNVAMQNGMVPMITDGLYKARDGITSIEEVLRVRYE